VHAHTCLYCVFCKEKISDNDLYYSMKLCRNEYLKFIVYQKVTRKYIYSNFLVYLNFVTSYSCWPCDFMLILLIFKAS
jgi:hypothetical protein